MPRLEIGDFARINKNRYGDVVEQFILTPDKEQDILDEHIFLISNIRSIRLGNKWYYEYTILSTASGRTQTMKWVNSTDTWYYFEKVNLDAKE